MKTLISFKMPFKSHHFNRNQRLWVRRGSGSLAVEVKGRFRGKGRYIVAWVSWGGKNKNAPNIKEIEVTDDFYNRIRGDCNCDEWYSTLRANLQ